MSTISSNDDELLLLIFDITDSITLNKSLVSKQFILNKQRMSDTLRLPKNVLPDGGNVVLFLIELDTDNSSEIIENKIKERSKELMDAYLTNDYPVIQRYLGDDDILGIKTIKTYNKKQPVSIGFNGIYRMDRYIYTINIH